jgi:energy-coupling factor transport system substrate-specific component
MSARRGRDIWGVLILLAASVVGVMSFVYPFVVPQLQQGSFQGAAHAQDAPLVFVVLVGLCLGAVVGNLGTGQMNAKTVAVLGILTAVNAVLRFVPGPAGFAAVFFLPILGGYVFGPTFGFLLGALSLLVSALIGAGVGPWLPYQMFAAGWVGLLSAMLPERLLCRSTWLERLSLAVWGLFLGLVYGAVMNLWFWPFVFSPGQSDMFWQAGASLTDTLRRYAVFYLATSLVWDLGRAGGNFLLLLLFGVPILRLLRRFRQRFRFHVQVVLEDELAHTELVPVD